MVYHVNYPYFYYGFANKDMGNTGLFDFEYATDPEDVSKEDFEYLKSYVSGLTQEEKEEDSVFAYAVHFSYYDENGERENIYAEGYDEFPEGFDGFIDKVRKETAEKFAERLKEKAENKYLGSYMNLSSPEYIEKEDFLQMSTDHVLAGGLFGKAPLVQFVGIPEEQMILEPAVIETEFMIG
jgi:hypothetical protein